MFEAAGLAGEGYKVAMAVIDVIIAMPHTHGGALVSRNDLMTGINMVEEAMVVGVKIMTVYSQLKLGIVTSPNAPGGHEYEGTVLRHVHEQKYKRKRAAAVSLDHSNKEATDSSEQTEVVSATNIYVFPCDRRTCAWCE